MGFVFVKITPEMIEEANKRNEVYKNQFGTKGTRLAEKDEKIRKTGYIGEQIVKKVFPKLHFSSDPDIDLCYNGLNFDVKSVGCNGEPKAEYVGTVFSHEGKKHCNFFIFTRILNDYSGGWVTGIISKKDFFKKCIEVKAGTKNNNFTYEHDRYTIEYRHLFMPEIEKKEEECQESN